MNPTQSNPPHPDAVSPRPKRPLRPGLALLTLLGVTMLGAVHAADLRQGLVSYWPLDTVAADYTTPDLVSGNHLTLNALDASSLVAGRHGQALAFDGAAQSHYLYFTSSGDTGLPVSPARRYSILLWVKGLGTNNVDTGQADLRIYSEGSSTSNNPLLALGTHAQGTANLARIYVRNAAGTEHVNYHSTGNVFDGNWHHLAWVSDNGQARLYIDGVLDSTRTYTPTTSPDEIVSVGAILRAAPSHYFTGTIDEVAVWERALTAEEVMEVMNNRVATPAPAFPPVVNLDPAVRRTSWSAMPGLLPREARARGR